MFYTRKLHGIFGILLLLNAQLHLISMYLYVSQMRHCKRRWWVRSINRSKSKLGYFNNQFKETYETDHEGFFNMTQRTFAQYDYLCHLLRSFLTKKSLRRPISVNKRVAVTFL